MQISYRNSDLPDYTLIFGNKSSQDILLKERLKKLNTDSNISVYFTIDKQEPDWDGLIGHIDREKIEAYLPAPANDTVIMCCGSKTFCRKFIQPLLLEIGYAYEDVFIF